MKTIPSLAEGFATGNLCPSRVLEECLDRWRELPELGAFLAVDEEGVVFLETVGGVDFQENEKDVDLGKSRTYQQWLTST